MLELRLLRLGWGARTIMYEFHYLEQLVAQLKNIYASVMRECLKSDFVVSLKLRNFSGEDLRTPDLVAGYPPNPSM